MYIISGRDESFLEKQLGGIDNLGMSAEHGGFMRFPGSKDWMNLTEMLDMSWMSEVEEVFKYYTEVSIIRLRSREAEGCLTITLAVAL